MHSNLSLNNIKNIKALFRVSYFKVMERSKGKSLKRINQRLTLKNLYPMIMKMKTIIRIFKRLLKIQSRELSMRLQKSNYFCKESTLPNLYQSLINFTSKLFKNLKQLIQIKFGNILVKNISDSVKNLLNNSVFYEYLSLNT